MSAIDRDWALATRGGLAAALAGLVIFAGCGSGDGGETGSGGQGFQATVEDAVTNLPYRIGFHRGTGSSYVIVRATDPTVASAKVTMAVAEREPAGRCALPSAVKGVPLRRESTGGGATGICVAGSEPTTAAPQRARVAELRMKAAIREAMCIGVTEVLACGG